MKPEGWLNALLVLVLPLAVSACAQSHHQAIAYTPLPAIAYPPTPTSSRAVTRVYADGRETPPTVAASPEDMRLATSIRQMLESDNAFEPDHIQITAYHGTISLRGSIGTEEQRQVLHNRVARLPGVERVDDKLMIDFAP